MKKNILAGLLAMACCAWISVSHAQAASNEEWRRDAAAIVNDIVAHHPDPFVKTGELTWRREVRAFMNELPELSEPARLARLMKLAAMIGDGHTRIELKSYDYGSWYPFRLYEFSDGYFVTSAHQSQASLAGAQVLEIADRPVAEIVNAARDLFGADNRLDRKERLYAVHNAYLMRGLGYANEDGALKIKFRLRNGRQITRTLTPTQMSAGFYPGGIPIFDWTYRREVYGTPIGADETAYHDEWVTALDGARASSFLSLDLQRPPSFQQMRQYSRRALPEQDAYYIQFNQTDDDGMVGYLRDAFAEIDQQKPKRLIVDIRYNFGGDGSTVVPMIHQFIQRSSDPSWEELYLVTGRKSFSAAIAVIDAFMEHTNVTLVGEPAGAALTSFGDAITRPYPAIGVDLSVSTVRHQMAAPDDIRAVIPVAAPAPLSFAGYSALRDEAIDPILRGEEMRSIPIIALTEGGDAARRVYRARQDRYGDLQWYAPPEEIELRVIGVELTRLGRHDEAINVARLNTEIHPYIWNTWYNLGGAMAAAGAPYATQRYAYYKCVVLLEPANWNAPNILALFERDGVDPAPADGCPAGAEE